jgi:hypothetical protein
MEQYISLREEYNLEREAPLSSARCQEIKDMYAIDDIRSENSTAGHAFYFQFWAHQWTDSVFIPGHTLPFNRYNFDDDGQGVYPLRGLDSILIDRKTGKFKLLGGGLPDVKWDNGAAELAPDNHRANENKILTAFHLMAVKMHNRFIEDYDVDYYTARGMVIAELNRITLNESLYLCDMDEDEFFNDIRIPNMHKTLEFNFALARWAHAQMPDTVNGKHVFDRVERSSSVDLVKLFDGSEMARILNLGVSTAMTEMMHVPAPHNILDRTFKRNNELGIISFEQLAQIIGVEFNRDITDTLPQLKDTPIWAGTLIEASTSGREGQLGPVGRRAIADGIAATLTHGLHGKGVWHDFVLPNPNKIDPTLNTVKYALGLEQV